MKKIVLFLALFPYGAALAQSEDASKLPDSKPTDFKSSGFVDANGYYDTRGTFDFTLNLLNNISPRTSYFTFSNFYSSSEKVELNRYYSEHHIYSKLSEKSPLDLSVQWMTLSGEKNDALRFGLRWRVNNATGLSEFCRNHGIQYTVAFHLVQLDADKSRSPFLTQVEHFYRKSWLNNRIYLCGFADMDISYTAGPTFMVVTEHQLGVKLIGGLYAVAEYRYNGYTANRQGVGLGLEYIVPY